MWFRLSLAPLIVTAAGVVAVALVCVPTEFVRTVTQPLLGLISALSGGVLRRVPRITQGVTTVAILAVSAAVVSIPLLGCFSWGACGLLPSPGVTCSGPCVVLGV